MFVQKQTQQKLRGEIKQFNLGRFFIVWIFSISGIEILAGFQCRELKVTQAIGKLDYENTTLDCNVLDYTALN